MELKCNNCTNNNKEECSKLKVWLPNGYAKLYFGDKCGQPQ